MRKLSLILCLVCCLLGAVTDSLPAYAAESFVSLYVDCDGGSCHTTRGMDLISGEDRAQVGSTVSSVYHFDDDPTAVDRDFTGWYVYDASTGAQLPGTGLLTTAQVNSYVIPNHPIRFVAQWTPRAGYPVTNITYAAFVNGEGEPCYGIRITLIHDGVSYSGLGFVSIPKSVYADWTGNVEVIWEPQEGYYIQANNRWLSERFSYTSSAKSFRKEKSLYCSANVTSKGKEIISSRRKVNDWYYQASFVAPEISRLSTAKASDVISGAAAIPASCTVEMAQFLSGSTYDRAVQAAQADYGTDPVLVMDIALRDDKGGTITQLNDYAQVRVDLPSDYSVKTGNTLIVAYLNAEGMLELCPTVCYLDETVPYVIFETNHFSPYVLIEVPAPPESEPEPPVAPPPPPVIVPDQPTAPTAPPADTPAEAPLTPTPTPAPMEPAPGAPVVPGPSAPPSDMPVAPPADAPAAPVAPPADPPAAPVAPPAAPTSPDGSSVQDSEPEAAQSSPFLPVVVLLAAAVCGTLLLLKRKKR